MTAERRADEGPSDAVAAREAAEADAPRAWSASGDISIPLDPDMAAQVLLAQDEPEDPEAGFSA